MSLLGCLRALRSAVLHLAEERLFLLAVLELTLHLVNEYQGDAETALWPFL